jgi:L-fuconolactonase
MVIDHLAKPQIRDRVLEPWASQIRVAAENPRLHCKLSGLVTEADAEHWTPDDLLPYVEVVVEAFGPGRLMYGSDWPVCTLAASYQHVYESLTYCLTKVSVNVEEEVERAIFGENAGRFYGVG